MEGTIHQIRVTLLDTSPPIWRRLLVLSNTNLRYLHYVLQAAMGWDDMHLYEYEVGDRRYGEIDEDAPADLKRAVRSRLTSVAPKVGDRFVYVYDFGDDWRHEILVEAITLPAPRRRYPACIGGARACPPEDIGGPFGYSRMLERRAASEVETHDIDLYRGYDFDAERFSSESATRRIRRIATNPSYRTWG